MRTRIIILAALAMVTLGVGTASASSGPSPSAGPKPSVMVTPGAIKVGGTLAFRATGLCTDAGNQVTFSVERLAPTDAAPISKSYGSVPVEKNGKATLTDASSAGLLPGYYQANAVDGCGPTAISFFAVCDGGCGTYPPAPRRANLNVPPGHAIGRPFTATASGLCEGLATFSIGGNVDLTSPPLRVGPEGTASYTFDTARLTPGRYAITLQQGEYCTNSTPSQFVSFTGDGAVPQTNAAGKSGNGPVTSVAQAAAGPAPAGAAATGKAGGNGGGKGGKPALRPTADGTVTCTSSSASANVVQIGLIALVAAAGIGGVAAIRRRPSGARVDDR